MFNIGFSEMLIIGAIALVILGPDKLPEFARSAAKWITYLRRSVNDVKNHVKDEFDRTAGDEFKEDVKQITQIGSEFRDFKQMDSNKVVDFIEMGADIFDKKDNAKSDSTTDTEKFDDNAVSFSEVVENSSPTNMTDMSTEASIVKELSKKSESNRETVSGESLNKKPESSQETVSGESLNKNPNNQNTET